MPACPRSYFSLRNLKNEIKDLDFQLKITKGFYFKLNNKLSLPPFIVYKDKYLTGLLLTRNQIKLFLEAN